jgi:hypothetical protein
MDNSLYKNLKNSFISEVKDLKRTTNKKDKVYIRTCINDTLDCFMRDFERQCLLTDLISEKQFDIYHLWMQSLACKLH